MFMPRFMLKLSWRNKRIPTSDFYVLHQLLTRTDRKTLYYHQLFLASVGSHQYQSFLALCYLQWPSYLYELVYKVFFSSFSLVYVQGMAGNIDLFLESRITSLYGQLL